MTASVSPPIRIGVVGAGFMGRQHIDFIRAAPGAALAAIADPAVTRRGGFECPTYEDAAGMLDAERAGCGHHRQPEPAACRDGCRMP